MFILAIDTSEKSGSIALLNNGSLVSEVCAKDPVVHSVWLLPAIDGFLKEAGVGLGSIDLFAITAGPGSFTGVRIGLSTVKGLAWTLKKNTFPVSTLRAISFNLFAPNFTGVVCPLLDARKGQIYSALYRFNGHETEVLMKDGVLAVDGLLKVIDDLGLDRGKIVFVGSGLGAYADAIRQNIKDALFAPVDSWRVKASAVGRLAYENFLHGGTALLPLHLSPVYLRRPETEFNLSMTKQTSA